MEWKGQGNAEAPALSARVGPCGLLGEVCAPASGYTILFSSTSTGYNLPEDGSPSGPSDVLPSVIPKS